MPFTPGVSMVGRAVQWQASLVQRAAAGAGPAEIGGVAVAAWRRIEAALSPVIGRGGVSALFERSLYLAKVRHPGLMAAHDDAHLSGDFAALGAVLANSSGADAAAAHGALLGSFIDILSGLIGTALTERLLLPVWDPLHGGDSAQDDAP